MEQQRLNTLNTSKTNMEMAQNMAKGIPPTNPQLATFLEGTERALNPSNLPPEAQKLGHDASVLVEDVKQVLLEKNKNEDIQGLIRDMGGLSTVVSGVSSSVAGTHPGTSTGKSLAVGAQKVKEKGKGLIAGQEAQATMQQAMESIKQLVRAFVGNHEFRGAFRELFSAFQWAFYQRSASRNQFISQNWAPTANVYSAGPAFANAQPGLPATQQISATTGPLPTTATTGVAGTTLPTATTTPIAAGAAPTYAAATTSSEGGYPPYHPMNPRNEMHRRLADLQPMTESERLMFRDRLIDALVKFNRTPELQQAMSNFLSVMSWIKGQALAMKPGVSSAISKVTATATGGAAAGIIPPTTTTSTTSRGPVSTTTTTTTTGVAGAGKTPDFKSVMKRFKRLVSEFSGGKSIDDLVFYTKEFFRMMKENAQLRNVIHDSGEFGLSFLRAGYPTKEAVPQDQIARLDHIIQESDSLFIGLANHYVIWRLLEEIQLVSEAIRDDPLRQKLAQDTRTFLSDFLIYDAMGKPQLNGEVVRQLKFLVLPILRENLAYIPLPRIEGSNEKMDFWVENVILATSDILPDNVKIDVRSKTLLNRPGMTGAANTLVRLSLDNVLVNLKDVRFWYRKKTFPKMTDEGFVDVFITGSGIRVCLDLMADFAQASQGSIFTVQNVKVNTDRVKIKIHESKHDFLYSVVLALFKGRVRREIQLKAEDSIRSNFARINAALSRFYLAAGEKRHAAGSGLASKTSGPVASALHTFVHPSTTH